jgi:hypothetical protein
MVQLLAYWTLPDRPPPPDSTQRIACICWESPVVEVRQVATGRLVGTLRGHENGVRCVASFELAARNATGLVSGGLDRVVRT